MMDINDITKDTFLLYSAVRGSQAQGLATETSDEDTVGIFCCPQDWLLGNTQQYIGQFASPKNDDVIYEVGKFMEGLLKSNPNYLEALFIPQQWVIYRSPILDPLWENRDAFITKGCFTTFYNYALSQIHKAKNLNKAMNTDPEEVKVRKTPLEFCIVPKRDKDGSLGLLRWLEMNSLNPAYCGATRLSGGVEFYSLYYDYAADKNMTLGNFSRIKYGHRGILKFLHLHEWLENRKSGMIKYRGLLDPANDSTQIRCSEISKADSKYPLISFQFNTGAYKDHCEKFYKYHEWVKNRNPVRFDLNKGYNFDAKNMCACVRLMTEAIEIAEGQGMRVDRSQIDREFLLDIKHHKKTYEEIMEYVGFLKERMDKAFAESMIPETVDPSLVNDIILNIRKRFYAESTY